MNTRLASLGIGALSVLGIVLVVATGGSDGYRVYVPLKNAYGLDQGSPVRIGSLDRGKVRLHIAKDDTIKAELDLDDDAGKVGKNARVAIVAANFLGQKRILLDPGDARTDPAPSGFVLRGDNVTTPTDLDQVLGLFDADTRTRARILIAAAGEAVVGRKADIGTLLEGLPAGANDAAHVVDQLKTDNTTMRALVRRSDNFVAEATRRRGDLERMISVLADTSATVAAKRAALRQALARAPGALRTLRGFSQELAATAQQLGPAARDIKATAPGLDATLAKVDAVRSAADPALKTATAVAPSLSRLARGATPVVEQALPTARSLTELSQALPPVTDTLNRSADNLIAILENWSRAIQFRDALGHVFRGEASFSPDAILSAVERLTAPKARAKKKRRPAASPAHPTAKPSLPAVPKLPKLPVKPALELPPAIQKTLDDVVNSVSAAAAPLLDYLLKP